MISGYSKWTCGRCDWVKFGSPKPVEFSSSQFYVGIAVTSHDNSRTATLIASRYKVDNKVDNIQLAYIGAVEMLLLQTEAEAIQACNLKVPECNGACAATKLTKWQCMSNGGARLTKTEIDWGHTKAEAEYACNERDPQCINSRDCSAVQIHKYRCLVKSIFGPKDVGPLETETNNAIDPWSINKQCKELYPCLNQMGQNSCIGSERVNWMCGTTNISSSQFHAGVAVTSHDIVGTGTLVASSTKIGESPGNFEGKSENGETINQ
jgi:hypothetical protein